MAETRGDAGNAFEFFVEAYGPKHDKAVERLIQDRDRLPAAGHSATFAGAPPGEAA